MAVLVYSVNEARNRDSVAVKRWRTVVNSNPLAGVLFSPTKERGDLFNIWLSISATLHAISYDGIFVFR